MTPFEEYVRTFIQQVWNEGLGDGERALRDLLTPTCHLEGVGGDVATLVGPEEYYPYWLHLRQAFPDLRCEVLEVEPFPDGESGKVTFRMTGTHHGSFIGKEPTGSRIDVRGYSIFWLKGGRATRARNAWELDELLRQIGHEVDSVDRAAREHLE